MNIFIHARQRIEVIAAQNEQETHTVEIVPRATLLERLRVVHADDTASVLRVMVEECK